MPASVNPVVETYSRLAQQYDDEVNVQSCWGRATEKALASLTIKDDYRVVLDVGCGTGRALLQLASSRCPNVRFIGIDPAENMRRLAIERTRRHPNITILDGCFENIPIESGSVDYLYSILAFHWVTDLDMAIREISRVLKPKGEMDLFFIGRNNGREFIQKTTPIFLKYMGPARLLDSARMRKQLKKEEALQLFSRALNPLELFVEESYQTYYDTLEGHWGWWVRIEGHFVRIPDTEREKCNQEVRKALLTLMEHQGIPYTIHQLHVGLRRA
jgi:ubiquinone/menaquinone biosynthesis C-methylase UbiE